MGNEMGNNNSSGLREEENTNSGDQGRSLQESGHGDGALVENHVVAVGEDKHHSEKETVLVSDAPKAGESHFVNQMLDEKEKEENEIHDPAGSAEVVVKPNDEAGNGTGEIQSTSLSEDSKDHEKPVQLSLEKNLSQLNDVKLEKQTSIKKEEEEMDNSILATKSLSSDRKPQELVDSKFDQPDLLAEIQTNPFELATNGSPLEIEDVLGLNLIFTSEENGHPIGDSDTISKDMAESSVEVCGTTQEVDLKRGDLSVKDMASKEEEMSCEERLEIQEDEIGNDMVQKSVTTEFHSGVEVQCNGDLPTELNPIRSDSQQAESEAISTDKSLNSHLEVSESIDNCITVAAESILIGKESEHCENKPDRCPAQPCEEAVKGSETDNANVSLPEMVMIESEFDNSHKRAPDSTSSDPGSNKDCIELANVCQSELVMIEHESVNKEKRAEDCSSSDPGINKDSTEEATQSKLVMIEPETENHGKRSTEYTSCNSGIRECIEEKAAENGHLTDVHIKDQNEASVEQHEVSTEVMVPASGVLSESSPINCKIEEVLKDKKIVEELEEKNEAIYGIENNTEITESGCQCVPPTLPVEQAEAFFPVPSLSLIHPQDNQQNIERESEKIKSSNESISELKQENCGEFLVTEVSSFDSTILMAETLFSKAELAIEKPGQDVSEYTTKPAVTVAESNPPVDNISGQCAKDDETPALASESFKAQESVGRFSTESNPNNSIQAQMQKSPSFGLDLRIEARSEESDRTPLLYQDKTAIEDFSTQTYISLEDSIEHTQNGQDTLQHQAMPVEEKVVRMERSDSDKLKTPFLGFLKEEEEAHILITPQKQENSNAAKKGNKEVLNLATKEVTSTSPKSKEKRKARSSLFTNCMCCTTVMN